MDSSRIRILFLADTHLGFDLPFKPRIQRRRRGPDFFNTFHQALQPAYDQSVDLVVHGGDLFYRTRVPEQLIDMALGPLVEVAESGIPVYLVPGNHERSKIPLRLWGTHENLHIFNRPRSFVYKKGSKSLALSGFPFARKIRDRFHDLVDRTGYEQFDADYRLLCIHQAVEGATVGVHNYTFRSGVEVIRGNDIPVDFTAVLSGHIHRAQVLTHDLQGTALAAPVIYPGSTERTSFVEREEAKGCMLLELGGDKPHLALNNGIRFINLPARPMENLVVDLNVIEDGSVLDEIQQRLVELDPDSVVRIQLLGVVTPQIEARLGAAELRKIAPPTMNVSLGMRHGVK